MQGQREESQGPCMIKRERSGPKKEPQSSKKEIRTREAWA